MLILNDTNDETGSVEAVGKEEEGSEIGECVSANQLFGMLSDIMMTHGSRLYCLRALKICFQPS